MKTCPICGKELPDNFVWDYCLKCEKELGFAKCYELEQIKKNEVKKDVPVQNQ